MEQDIREEQIPDFGNLLVQEFLTSGLPHPVETLPEECKLALRRSDPEAFGSSMAKNKYFSEYPVNRASALCYALYIWYHKIFN